MRNIPYNDQDNDIVHWVIIIFHKKEWDRDKYLVVQNKETENISFVSWAKETRDKNLSDTCQREVKEELAIDPEKYILIPTSVIQEFVFWPKKKEQIA